MQLKDIFLSIPRSTLQTLVKYHILRESVLVWYDIIRFFDSLPDTLKQMEKYIITADKHCISDEQCRKVVNKLNRYI